MGKSVVKVRDLQSFREVDGMGEALSVGVDTWRSLRPFILDGVTYLSGARYESPYDDFKPNHIYKDYMDILKYIKGSSFRKGSDQPPLEFETICRIRMTEVHQPSKGE
jgi:hypothetical protein